MLENDKNIFNLKIKLTMLNFEIALLEKNYEKCDFLFTYSLPTLINITRDITRKKKKDVQALSYINITIANLHNHDIA